MSTSPLHIALFGATGGTGSLFLRQALEAGHHVTALVRDARRMRLAHPRLTLVVGSVLDHERVVQTVQGVDAVVCALGAPPRSGSRIREQGTRVIVQAMHATGVRRLVVQSSHGIGETAQELPWLMRWLVAPLYLKPVFDDHERQEAVVHGSSLDWTLIRPPHLTDGEPASALASGPAFDPATMTMKIARTDVARFLLQQVEATPATRETLVVSTATVAASVNPGASVALAS